MAFIDIPNVVVKGFSACVPPDIDENINYSLLTEEERAKVISSIGVERKRVAKDNVSASDLCYKAAEKLIEELHWDKNDIGCLIFVSILSPAAKMSALISCARAYSAAFSNFSSLTNFL